MDYQEYPKVVQDKNGDDVLAHSAEEEAKITGKSQASLEKQAAENEKVEDKSEDELVKELEKQIADKGTAVSEADMVKQTDLAQKIAAIKRGPGRPKKTEEKK